MQIRRNEYYYFASRDACVPTKKTKKMITEEEYKLINNVAVHISPDSKAAMIVVLTDDGTRMAIAGNEENVSKMKERMRRCFGL